MKPFLPHALGSGTPWAPQHTVPVFILAAATVFVEGWKQYRVHVTKNWKIYDWDEDQVRARLPPMCKGGGQGRKMHHIRHVSCMRCVPMNEACVL